MVRLSSLLGERRQRASVAWAGCVEESAASGRRRNAGNSRWAGRIQSLDVAAHIGEERATVRRACVAGHLNLGVEALAEARVASRPGSGAVENIARERQTGREVLPARRPVVQLEA